MEQELSEFVSLQLEAVNEKTSSDRLTELAKISSELARLVAKNPCATPELLRELANSSDATTRQNVAANPNTPTEVLLTLGSEFPGQLLNNPIFSLLWLENPNLFNEIPWTTLLSLLKHESVPVSFLEWAANQLNPEVQFAVAINVQTPKTLLEKLVHSEYVEVQEAAGMHVNLAGEMSQSWDETAREAIGTTTFQTNNKKYIENVAKRGLIPELVIEQLVRNKDRGVRALLAFNPNTPVNFLEQLAQDEENWVRRGVACNPNTPVNLLEELGRDKYSEVRIGVASNPNTPVNCLEQLAQDRNNWVRSNVASNPNTPLRLLDKLLAQLAQNEDDDVRENVAKNPNTSIELLKQLARDNHALVRFYVVENPNTPVNLLEQLARDKDNWVRWTVASNPNIPTNCLEQLALDKDNWVRMSVACNVNTPIKLLEQLAQDENNYVRRCVAGNPNTPVKLLEQLAQDDALDARDRVLPVVGNSNISVKLPKQLARDGNIWVRESVAQNSNTSVNFFLEMMLKFDEQSATPSLSRFLALLHPQTQGLALAENYHSEAWLERYAITHNPNTPTDTLKALANDANRIVRAAAKANLQTRQSKI